MVQNKYGDIVIRLTIEAERYQYLGQSTILNKEYSDKGSPYAEYNIANNQVVSQKMFGLHGLVTPGKEETLNTNGGLMYYQYDGANSVTELTNRHGEVIENYRYDAFGNIFTGITSPYNTTGYTGQDYDDVAGLVQMDARWYDPNVGRFTTQDSYLGDAYTSQSLNRYSYVMNNPVNMWDPTGHVPEWVGDNVHILLTDDKKFMDLYVLDRWSNSYSGWYKMGEIKTDDEVRLLYQATVTNTWEYDHYKLYQDSDDNTMYHVIRDSEITEIYTQTDYYYNTVIKPATNIFAESQFIIKEVLGDPPKDSDPTKNSATYALSISTKKVGNRAEELCELEPDEIIVQKTTEETTGINSLITGAVQIELNAIMGGTDLDVVGVFGDKTKGKVEEFQNKYELPANGKLDYQTFYQLQIEFEQKKPYIHKKNMSHMKTTYYDNDNIFDNGVVDIKNFNKSQIEYKQDDVLDKNIKGTGKSDWIPDVMQLNGTSGQEQYLASRLSRLGIPWGQEKVDALWEAVSDINKQYGVQIDPRFLLAIIIQEGTGSFNTSSSNLAADGQNGVETNFALDLMKANSLVFGKILGYIEYGSDFRQVVANNTDKSGISGSGDIFQYCNWGTPIINLNKGTVGTGVYAGDGSWHDGVRSIYEKLAYTGAASDYSSYLSKLNGNIVNNIAQGINIPAYSFVASQNAQDSYGNPNGKWTIIGKK